MQFLEKLNDEGKGLRPDWMHKKMSSTYLLFMQLEKARTIKIGSLGRCRFGKGHYIYVGSAKRNFHHRINRHLRQKKKIHWHIDYLLRYARIIKIWSSGLPEDKVADILSTMMQVPVPHFGASDKKNKSHLFYGKMCQDMADMALRRVH
jgi:Uri superfamily endonuclease